MLPLWLSYRYIKSMEPPVINDERERPERSQAEQQRDAADKQISVFDGLN